MSIFDLGKNSNTYGKRMQLAPTRTTRDAKLNRVCCPWCGSGDILRLEPTLCDTYKCEKCLGAFSLVKQPSSSFLPREGLVRQ